MALHSMRSRIVGTAVLIAGLAASALNPFYAPTVVRADNPSVVQPGGAPETPTSGIDDKCITGEYTVAPGDTGYGIWKKRVGDCMTYDAFKATVETQNNGNLIDRIEDGTTFTGLSLLKEPAVVATVAPSLEVTVTAKAITQDIPQSITPGKGICPVDLSLPGVSIGERFSDSHRGVDIIGPYGTPHRSPGSCMMLKLLIDQNGGHEAQMMCSDIGLPDPAHDLFSLGHFDFKYDNFQTLRWYQIYQRRLFEEDGSTRTGGFGTPGMKHLKLDPAEDLKLYMGSTGWSGLVHTHMSVLLWDEGSRSFSQQDPCIYVDCCDR